MKIYLSGAISAIADNNTQNFKYYQIELEKKGHTVINPLEVGLGVAEKTWSQFMRADIKAMMDCDAVAVLNDWGNSKGSPIEIFLAQELGMEVFYADGGKPFEYHLTLKSKYDGVK